MALSSHAIESFYKAHIGYLIRNPTKTGLDMKYLCPLSIWEEVQIPSRI